jgi:hypothetical protein
VLICPDCQRGRDWTADLARCAACGSSRLARALGRTECKDCGAEDRVAESGSAGATSVTSDAALLAEQVRAALERQRRT